MLEVVRHQYQQPMPAYAHHPLTDASNAPIYNFNLLILYEYLPKIELFYLLDVLDLPK